MNKCIRFVHTRLFPSVCTLCGAPGHADKDLCSACERDLPWLGPACWRCARPLHNGKTLCGVCHRRPPTFDRTIAALHYRRPVDALVQRLKFDCRLHYARLLGALLTQRLRDQLDRLPDVLVPVPLHPTRQRQRGFNQATELARPIVRALGIAMAPHCCQRVRATDTQSLLSRQARRANLRGAFRVATVPGAHVAIIDDVVTTGSTVQAMAQCLRAAGAERIDVWCVARADHD